MERYMEKKEGFTSLVLCQRGHLSIENMPEALQMDCNIGIQIASDGRIWVYIDGVAFIRFKPDPAGVRV
jgi:hypothetical protein